MTRLAIDTAALTHAAPTDYLTIQQMTAGPLVHLTTYPAGLGFGVSVSVAAINAAVEETPSCVDCLAGYSVVVDPDGDWWVSRAHEETCPTWASLQ